MTMSERTRYPLCWPEGWPRARFRTQSKFREHGHLRTMEKATGFLQAELDRLGAVNSILSSNIPLRLDGLPRSNIGTPRDTGVAVFFQLNGKPTSLACDKWDRVECNVWAIAKHIEAIRGQERWGVGTLGQAFRGYQALPEFAGDQWWRVLGVAINASPDQVRSAYLLLAKKHHPDNQGDPELFRRVQSAWEAFQARERDL